MVMMITYTAAKSGQLLTTAMQLPSFSASGEREEAKWKPERGKIGKNPHLVSMVPIYF